MTDLLSKTPSTGLRHPWRKVPESDAQSLEEGARKRCSEYAALPHITAVVGSTVASLRICSFSLCNSGM